MEQKKHRAGKIIRRIILLFLLLIAGCCVYTVHMMHKVFSRGDYPDKRYSLMTRFSDVTPAYSRETVSFRSGDNMLVGYIYGAENDKGLIVWSHGIGCGHEAYLDDILWFADHGWRVCERYFRPWRQQRRRYHHRRQNHHRSLGTMRRRHRRRRRG